MGRPKCRWEDEMDEDSTEQEWMGKSCWEGHTSWCRVVEAVEEQTEEESIFLIFTFLIKQLAPFYSI